MCDGQLDDESSKFHIIAQAMSLIPKWMLQNQTFRQMRQEIMILLVNALLRKPLVLKGISPGEKKRNNIK